MARDGSFGIPNSIQNFGAAWSVTPGQVFLSECEQGLCAIFEDPIIGVGVGSADKQWLRVNDRWSQMIGYSREELAIADWTKLTHPDDLARSLAQYKRLLLGEIDHYYLDKRHIRKDGSILYTKVSINAVRNEDSTLKYVIGLAVDTTQGKETEHALADMRRQLIEAQERERARIGRELHDDVLQRLSLLAINIGRIAETPDHNPMLLRQLRSEVDEISKGLRALSDDLHAWSLEYLGGVSGIKSWCADFARRHKLLVSFHSNVQTPLSHPIGIALFRITQEALHNVLSHSGTNRITVSLEERSNEVNLLIVDTGRGFNIDDVHSGHGLISMRERARLVGGNLTVESDLRGTSILVSAPL